MKVSTVVFAALLCTSLPTWSQSSTHAESPGHSNTNQAQTPTADKMPHASFSAGDLLISEVISRVTPPGAKAGAGYLTITNNGSTDDVLLGGSVNFAKEVQVHTMEMVDDVMKMRRLKEGLIIPAGETVQLISGADHLMFMGLSAPITLDNTDNKITLKFKHAGEVVIALEVIPLM